MDRLQRRSGSAFTPTPFATVATQVGWNVECLRASMGHADYTVPQRYVSLPSDRDPCRIKGWEEFVTDPARGL